MTNGLRRPSGPSRRGNVAVIIALVVTVLIASAAVVLDLGYARLVQTQLQNAADAAALAGVREIDGTTAGLTSARNRAVSIASQNIAAGSGVTLATNSGNAADGDIVLGVWDLEDQTFTASTDASLVNAMEVRARIPSLGMFLMPMFGREDVPVSAKSRTLLLTGGAASTECFIPLAMASCLVDRYTVAGLQNVTLKLQPAGIDNVGYARPGASPNASWTRTQIGNCQSSGEIEIGDSLGLQNGQATSALAEFVTAVENSSTRWSTTRWGTQPARNVNSSIAAAQYGRTFEGIVPVFDGGTSYCTGTGGSYNGFAPIVGFMWGAIYDVINKGSSSNRTILMRLDSMDEHDEGTGVGGPDWGVTATDPPRILPMD